MEQLKVDNEIVENVNNVIKNKNLIDSLKSLWTSIKKNPWKSIVSIVVAVVFAVLGIGSVISPTSEIQPEPTYYAITVDIGNSGLNAVTSSGVKKQFLYEVDSEIRCSKFAALRLQKEYTVEISGVLDIDMLNTKAVGYVGDRKAYPIEKPEYYAVSFNTKFAVAETAKYVFVIDESGTRYVNAKIENGYLDIDTYYVIADQDKNWSIRGTVQENGTIDGYVYYEIQDENYNIIDAFFYHSVYNVLIKEVVKNA